MSAPDRRKLVDREHRALSVPRQRHGSATAAPRRSDWSIGEAGAPCARRRQGCRQRGVEAAQERRPSNTIPPPMH
jgi:hypothetical protein